MSGNGRGPPKLTYTEGKYSNTDPMNDGNPESTRRSTLPLAGRGAGRGSTLRTPTQQPRRNTLLSVAVNQEDATMADTSRVITPHTTGEKRSLDITKIGKLPSTPETPETPGGDDDSQEDDMFDGELREPRGTNFARRRQ